MPGDRVRLALAKWIRRLPALRRRALQQVEIKKGAGCTSAAAAVTKHR